MEKVQQRLVNTHPPHLAEEDFDKRTIEDQENTLGKPSLHACPAPVSFTTPFVLPLSEHWPLICTQM